MKNLIMTAFFITGLGFTHEIMTDMEQLLSWAVPFIIVCLVWQIVSLKEDREEQLKYIKR